MTEILVSSLNPKSLSGYLVPLITKGEIENRDQTVEVFISETPSKSASEIFEIVRRIPGQETVSLSHLRRFNKDSFLPARLRTNAPDDTLHAILAPTSIISATDLAALLNSSLPLAFTAKSRDHEIVPKTNPQIVASPATYSPVLEIRRTKVPLYPPISREHAQSLSENFWPTIFTNSNPFGPHPAIVSKAQAEITQDAGTFMALGRELGSQAERIGCGAEVGAVVVARANGRSEVLVGAGDGRWAQFRDHDQRPQQHQEEGAGARVRPTGHPPGHAVMRAIALVAKKRRRAAAQRDQPRSQQQPARGDPEHHASIFADTPLTELERRLYDQQNLEAGGYVCLDLEMYVTHEPCVMCSMALVHSRFGRVVVGRRMMRTGALFAAVLSGAEADRGAGCVGPGGDTGLGYGLFWRDDLNWRFLAWQWVQDGEDEEGDSRQGRLAAIDENVHV